MYIYHKNRNIWFQFIFLKKWLKNRNIEKLVLLGYEYWFLFFFFHVGVLLFSYPQMSIMVSPLASSNNIFHYLLKFSSSILLPSLDKALEYLNQACLLGLKNCSWQEACSQAMVIDPSWPQFDDVEEDIEAMNLRTSLVVCSWNDI